MTNQKYQQLLSFQVFKHVLNPKQPPGNPQSPFSIVTALVDRIKVQSSILPDQVRIISQITEPLNIIISRTAVEPDKDRSWVRFPIGCWAFSSSILSYVSLSSSLEVVQDYNFF